RRGGPCRGQTRARDGPREAGRHRGGAGRDAPRRARALARAALHELVAWRRRRLLVVVEAEAALPAEVARQHHAAEQRRRGEARLAILLVEKRGHVEDDVEPDEV